MEALIRAARRDESDALLDLYDWFFEEPGYKPAGWDVEAARGRLRESLESSENLVLVAEEEGTLVGLLCAYLDIRSVRYGQRCWVEDLAVHPDRRSQGIGAGLLAEARDWARARGATHIELDTGRARSDAQRFYERQGESHQGISYSWPL
ncbi:MAG: GNAT family N-acetyltransferase [Thermoleophilaceae bacterium]